MSAVKALIGISLADILRRKAASLLVVGSVAGVVGVFVAILSAASGLRAAGASTGRVDRVIAFGVGARSEEASTLSRDAIATLASFAMVDRDATGQPLASGEVLTQAIVQRAAGNTEAKVTVRGLGERWQAIRREIHIVSGRSFRSGTRELIVGRYARQAFAHLNIGDHVQLNDGPWTLVGIFESNGDLHESELLGDAQTVLAANHSDYLNIALLQLHSPGDIAALRTVLKARPDIAAFVLPEKLYYTARTKAQAEALQRTGYLVGGIMGFGALFAILTAMHLAISGRSREISTLRAIGFRSGGIVASIFAQVGVLVFAGALGGLLVAWVLCEGSTALSAAVDITNAHILFSEQVNLTLFVYSAAVAAVLTLFSAALSTLMILRVPITAGNVGAFD